ncbi:phage tail protein [Grimontia sp. NTOU-MAR1]|uniref:phage tail protein n=1 Tax=Grimontia sp. NTOU-MAR1 TaxID=3111011 RepID=UPI002DBE7F77|nr:phage tail protein [Grimontia sp. NTOU-MAR1]WRV96515.1 phage tail protein [Grimontia sp. NTOU-MAR1]
MGHSNVTPYHQTHLEHLTDYMCAHMSGVVLANKIDAWQENAQLTVSGEDLGNGGFLMAQWQYQAVVSIEGFPHKAIDPRYLLASVACWISEFDPDRSQKGLADPSVSVDVLDDGSVDVAIELELCEDIQMVPDSEGHIRYQGTQYRVEAVPIWTAEDVEIRYETGH